MAEATSQRTRTLNPSRQTRAMRTADRIVAACQELLAEWTFDELSLDRILKRARATTGSFYPRFADKEALFEHLEELYYSDLRTALGSFAADQAGENATLQHFLARHTGADDLVAEMARDVVALVVDFQRRNLGITRGLMLRHRTRGKRQREDRIRELNAQLREALAPFLTDAVRGAIRHPDAGRAVLGGFLMVWGAARERLLFSPACFDVPAPPARELTEELTRAFLGYLGVGEPGGDGGQGTGDSTR